MPMGIQALHDPREPICSTWKWSECRVVTCGLHYLPVIVSHLVLVFLHVQDFCTHNIMYPQSCFPSKPFPQLSVLAQSWSYG